MKLQDVKKQIIKNKYLIIVSAFALVLISVIIYLLRHKFCYVSIDITKVNNLSAQLFSLLSLIIVSAVSISIGVISNKRNSERQKLDRKMEAYDKLISYSSGYTRLFNIYIPKMIEHLNKIKELNITKVNECEKNVFLLEYNKLKESGILLANEVKPVYFNVKDFQVFLTFFPKRYSHLFNNNFNSDNYVNAWKKLTNTYQLIEYFIGALEDINYSKEEYEDIDSSTLLLDLSKFADELKEELKC